MNLDLHPVDPPGPTFLCASDEEPEPEQCTCPGKPAGEWTLTLDGGSLSLVHKACGKELSQGDWHDYIYAEIPVTVTYESCPNAGGWHGVSHRCDCDFYFNLTPIHPEAAP